jgi:hypothetical protein
MRFALLFLITLKLRVVTNHGWNRGRVVTRFLVAQGKSAHIERPVRKFQRNLYIQALLGGIALTLSLTTVWGNLENLVQVPHLDLIWVCPMFWIFVVAAFAVVRLRYR